MTLGRAIDDALGAAGTTGKVEAEAGDARAEVEVSDADRLGVKVRSVKVTRSTARDVGAEAASLPERLRSIPERLQPVEVDPKLGGATLRTRPDDMRKREFFQVDVHGERDVEVRRYKVGAKGRKPVDFTMTRDQLERLVDELDS